MLLLQLELVAVRHEVMCVYNTYFYCSCCCASNNRAQGAGLSCISRSVRHRNAVQVVYTFFFSEVAAIVGRHQRGLPAERSSKIGLEDTGCRVLPLQSLLGWRRGLVGLRKKLEYEAQRRAITSPVVILWARRIETCCPRIAQADSGRSVNKRNSSMAGRSQFRRPHVLTKCIVSVRAFDFSIS